MKFSVFIALLSGLICAAPLYAINKREVVMSEIKTKHSVLEKALFAELINKAIDALKSIEAELQKPANRKLTVEKAQQAKAKLEKKQEKLKQLVVLVNDNDAQQECIKLIQSDADIRELVFEEIASQLMDSRISRPFNLPVAFNHISQMDIFCLLVGVLTQKDGRYEELRGAITSCIGVEQPFEIKIALDKKQFTELIPAKAKEKLFKNNANVTLSRLTHLLNVR